MQAIIRAANEQGISIDQVNQAIAQIEEVKQQNVALVEQAAARVEDMQQQVVKLSGLVGNFKLISGKSVTGTEPPAGIQYAPELRHCLFFRLTRQGASKYLMRNFLDQFHHGLLRQCRGAA
jgi:hypothetical protein